MTPSRLLYHRLLHPDDADTSGKTDPTTLADELNAAPAPTEDGLLEREFEYTANGATRKETFAEILKRASKSYGADAAFREASEMRDGSKTLQAKADAHDQLLETIKGFKARDESAFRAMAELLEMDRENPGIADELWQFLSGKATLDAKGGAPANAAGAASPGAGGPDRELLGQLRQMSGVCKDMGVDLATGMRLALNASGKWADNEARRRVEKALTQDKIFGTILKRKPDSRSTLVETIYRNAEGRASNGVALDDAINEAIKEAAGLIAASAPRDAGSALPQQFLGVGPAPVAVPQSGIHPAKRPILDKRRLSDPTYSKEFIEQLQAHYQQAAAIEEE